MRNVYVTILAMLVFGITQAETPEVNEKPNENPSNWVIGHGIGINMSQVGLKNWSAGGDASISFVMNGMFDAKMIKGRHMWYNKMSGEWGMLRIKNVLTV